MENLFERCNSTGPIKRNCKIVFSLGCGFTLTLTVTSIFTRIH